MRKASLAVAVCLLASVVFAADPAPIPNEGNTAETQIMSGPFKLVPLGKDRAYMTYEVTGVRISEAADLFHNASVRCIGALTIVTGAFDDEAGVCVLTRPDGDQAFTSYKGAGKSGAEAKGTWKFTGGTGKLAGIEGSGEFTRYGVRPAVDGTSQSVTKTTGRYKLSPASASR